MAETRSSSPDRAPAGAPPSAPAADGLAARSAALDLLERIRDGASLDEALSACRSFEALEGADRRFARALATLVLRRRGTLDHVIGAYLDRPLAKRAVRVMDVLRIAGAQLLFMETPPHAAVSTAVSVVGERRENAGYAKLVNAITRKIAKSGAKTIDGLPDRIDTPSWMWRRWERSFGPKAARAIAQAHRAPAPLDLTLKDAATASDWADRLDAEQIFPGTVRLRESAPVKSLPGFDEGAWWVQDAAASLPARLLGDVAGKRVFDLCAAPGGKTLQLAATGARVVAVDKSESRIERLRENLNRTGLQAQIIEADVLKWSPAEKADAILLDAPCTATGTIRRHPDLPWSKTDEQVASLAKLQAQMIDVAVSMLAPGGVLVYCVCSLEPEEGERQITAALERHDGLTLEPVTADDLGGFAQGVSRGGHLRTAPFMLADKGGMDGFFAARLRLNP
ncbi:MAG: transcription antitermination factor NusB [Pseudomonadota bacterium]